MVGVMLMGRVLPIDDDLRQHRRREILAAITRRYAPAPSPRKSDIPAKSFGPAPKEGDEPLFHAAEDEDAQDVVPTANDEALALALQQEELGSDEDEADPALARALALSRKEQVNPPSETDSDEFEEVSVAPSGTTTPHELIVIDDSDEDADAGVTAVPQPSDKNDVGAVAVSVDDSSDEEPAAVATGAGSAHSVMSALARRRSGKPVQTSHLSRAVLPTAKPSSSLVSGESALTTAPPASTKPLSPVPTPIGRPREQPSPELRPARVASASPEPRPVLSSENAATGNSSPEAIPTAEGLNTNNGQLLLQPEGDNSDSDDLVEVNTDNEISGQTDYDVDLDDIEVDTPATENDAEADFPTAAYHSESDDDEAIPWSRSPTPAERNATGDSSMQTIGSEPVSDGEMNAAEMEQEEDDYARFISQITNRDLNEVRTEIDDEIRILNQQTKAALRDSDEITQSMVVQVQTLLKYFGIPYVTAPMEAEAQCAKLAELNLVDGIITDDSDVFLFGGTQCFKNIFNEAKFAEVFAATDIERELSLTRERLISLSYLLGSDYSIGLPGVGPVMALELLANFPGPEGLDRFKEWWLKVQRGQDLPVEADTDWKRRFVSVGVSL